MTANPEHHVDVSALQDLKDIMEGEFGMLIDTFVVDSSSKIDELAAAIQASDADSVRKIAHSLKGSSSNICAGALSEYARQLEFMGKEGSTNGAAEILEKLAAEFEVVKEVLNNNL